MSVTEVHFCEDEGQEPQEPHEVLQKRGRQIASEISKVGIATTSPLTCEVQTRLKEVKASVWRNQVKARLVVPPSRRPMKRLRPS